MFVSDAHTRTALVRCRPQAPPRTGRHGSSSVTILSPAWRRDNTTCVHAPHPTKPSRPGPLSSDSRQRTPDPTCTCTGGSTLQGLNLTSMPLLDPDSETHSWSHQIHARQTRPPRRTADFYSRRRGAYSLPLAAFEKPGELMHMLAETNEGARVR